MPDLSDYWPILVAFAMLVAGGVGIPPIPEEIPVIGAGIWVASNPELGPVRWVILPVCIAGILISDVMLYGIGWWWGSRLWQHRLLARLIPEAKRVQIEANFHRYGVSILLMVRWLPGIRSPMFITAGTMKLPLIRFVIADAIAASVGHSLLFILSYWFGDQFRELVLGVERTLDSTLRPLLALAAIVLVAGYLFYHFLRRPVSTGDPAELPILGPPVAAKIEHHEKPPCPPATNPPPDMPNGVERPAAGAPAEGVTEQERGA